jgi:hypothetical protein
MTPGGFEPAIPISEQPHTHALDRASTGIGKRRVLAHKIKTEITFMAYLTVRVCDRHSTSLETRDWAIHVQSIGESSRIL